MLFRSTPYRAVVAFPLQQALSGQGALDLMRDYALATGSDIDEVAGSVLAGRLDADALRGTR